MIYWNGLNLLLSDYKTMIIRITAIAINSLILYLTFINLGDIEDDVLIAY